MAGAAPLAARILSFTEVFALPTYTLPAALSAELEIRKSTKLSTSRTLI